MNKVYESFKKYRSDIQMTQMELTKAMNVFIKDKNLPYDLKRLDGWLCDCCDGGKFILLPLEDEAVQGGRKRYMQCQICGCYSHL